MCSLKKFKKTKGFTLIEVLMALAITAMLLTALAVAFNASMKNYSDNEDLFRASNKARQAITLILPQIRTAQSVDPCSPSNECAIVTSAGDSVTFNYDSSADKLYMIKNNTSYLMCENVTDMSFTKYVYGTFVKSVQISMTVDDDSASKKFSAATVVRRNLE